MVKEYPYIVKPVNAEEYGVKYMIEYVDFPGLTGGGDTVEEALSIAQEAMALYQEVLEKERCTISDTKAPNPTGRVTLRLSKSLHANVVDLAEREGISLNAFIVEALNQKVHGTSPSDKIQKLIESYIEEIKSSFISELFELKNESLRTRSGFISVQDESATFSTANQIFGGKANVFKC